MRGLNAELDAQLKALKQRKGPGGQELDHCSAMLKNLSQHVKQLAVGIDNEVAKLRAAAGPRAGPSARASGGAPAAAPVRGPSNVPAAQQLNPPPPQLNRPPVVKKEKPVPTGRHHPYQRPSGGGGAAAGFSVRMVDSASAVHTHKIFCQCQVGGEAIWYEHNFQIMMCGDCKKHFEKQKLDRPPEFSKMDGAYFAREASRPSPARGMGGAAGPRVVISAPAVLANLDEHMPNATRVCSCNGTTTATWYCHNCDHSMCDFCEHGHRMIAFDEPHLVTKQSGPRGGEGSRP